MLDFTNFHGVASILQWNLSFVGQYIIWCIKNRTKHNSKTLLSLVWFSMHYTLLSRQSRAGTEIKSSHLLLKNSKILKREGFSNSFNLRSKFQSFHLISSINEVQVSVHPILIKGEWGQMMPTALLLDHPDLKILIINQLC